MKNHLIIFFVLISNTIFSQSRNVEKYYDYINQAELAIAESDYKSGLKFYKKAFKNHDEPFNNDYRNALLCSCQLQKEKNVKQYYSALKQRKFNFRNIKKHCIKNIGESQWETLEALNIPLTIDTVYTKALVDILNKDQGLRDFVYSNGGYDTHEDTTRFVDSLNMLALKRLIDTYGFPTEAISSSRNGLFIPLLHNRQGDSPRNELDELLKTQVKLGNFHASIYARLNDEYMNNTTQPNLYGIEHQVIINEKIFYDYAINEAEIDENRKTIFIASMKAQRLKLNSNKLEEGYILSPRGRVSYTIDDEKEAEKMMQTMKEIEANYLTAQKR